MFTRTYAYICTDPREAVIVAVGIVLLGLLVWALVTKEEERIY